MFREDSIEVGVATDRRNTLKYTTYPPNLISAEDLSRANRG